MPKSEQEFKGLYLQIHAAVLIEEVEFLKRQRPEQSKSVQQEWDVVIKALTDRITKIREFI